MSMAVVVFENVQYKRNFNTRKSSAKAETSPSRGFNDPGAMSSGPLYLGFDLSTQQLKGSYVPVYAVAITSKLAVACEARVEFDVDCPKYGVEKGVHVSGEKREVYAPVAMWLEALDLILERLRENGLQFGNVKGVSGAGQQHGSVYWSQEAENRLGTLDPSKTLREQLVPDAFSHPWSPNWQDASTQGECDRFDECLGGEEELAKITGSKAHHRFTGPQILRFREKHPEVYKSTSRISLVSSFLASVFLGSIAPIDISDVCGMNLWDIEGGHWNEPLLALVAGREGIGDLRRKLGDVRKDGESAMGSISTWFVSRYSFPGDCQIAPFTGDNPSTILSLPLRPLDAIISLGTSTTFLISTPKYIPHSSYHFFNHPTTPGLHMFMLCYKNGGLARERVRDSINKSLNIKEEGSWDEFDRAVRSSLYLGMRRSSDPIHLGLYFPLPEIVPNVRPGTWRFYYNPSTGSLNEVKESSGYWQIPRDDARIIVESQLLSLRLRSQNLVHAPNPDLPPQPRRIYLVGGGSLNLTIASLVGDVLGGVEGVYRLDVGGNACALGAAYRAAWSRERTTGERFEEFIGTRWQEREAVEKIGDGYNTSTFGEYGNVLKGFEEMERKVLEIDDTTSIID
ncbi:hypothetical protein FGG08_003050 [Glutinoglossum americanum]|uniref:Xylulose kinase n=1 Tax=Glutinoglossum americanum TaxID=1670608 RepID=A0A9P8I3E6_9PEZI|nr:hypothetical protein FGG08_003050 [Glutinoglossum americanum]